MAFDPQIPSSPARPADAERRARIVAAAERAFVRHGFHAATMHDIAEEAGMSAGNLYRYFASKESLVEDLCLCDRDARMSEFEQLTDGVDLCAALTKLICDGLMRHPREKALLAVEISAEAGRNPRVAEILRVFDASSLEGLRVLLARAQADGAASAALDPDLTARAIFTFVTGLFKRIALEPDFDPATEAKAAAGLLRALFAGAISKER